VEVLEYLTLSMWTVEASIISHDYTIQTRNLHMIAWPKIHDFLSQKKELAAAEKCRSVHYLRG
jgi:hypothetical protein